MSIYKNWSETVKFYPEQIFFPSTKTKIADIITIARENKKSVRVVGSAHSFTPLIETELLVSLDKYTGIVSVDEDNEHVTVRAGTKLKKFGELLFDKGYMMENLGDIDVQSIAGALLTGTHGTGQEFGILATQVHAIEFINGRGETIYCNAEDNPEIFRSVLVSFGTMGILTEITLKVVPEYKLHYKGSKTDFDEVLENLDNYIINNRNFEFYWFPYSDHIQLKESNLTEEPVKNGKLSSFFNERLMENTVFGMICRFVKIFPKSASFFSKIAGATISNREKIDWGHRVYATIRKVRFVEMEYSLPVDTCEDVLREIKLFIEEEKIKVNFPIEVRFVKADDIYLSPAFGEDRCYIAVHMYKGMPYQKYLLGCQEIFLKYKGRPHWGKIHYLSKEELIEKYPKFTKFDEIRRGMDPDGIFSNEHVRLLFE